MEIEVGWGVGVVLLLPVTSQQNRNHLRFGWSGSGRLGFSLEAGRGRSTSYACIRAVNSVVECYLHTVEVVGSNPTVRTILLNFPRFL